MTYVYIADRDRAYLTAHDAMKGEMDRLAQRALDAGHNFDDVCIHMSASGRKNMSKQYPIGIVDEAIAAMKKGMNMYLILEYRDDRSPVFSDDDNSTYSVVIDTYKRED